VGLAVQEVGDTVLRGRPHLPLCVVEALVAGLAGLGLAGLGRSEGVAGVAVLTVHPVLVVLAGRGHPVLLGDDAQRVAAAAALLTLDEGVGLHVRERQHVDGEQPLGVLAGQILDRLILVALLAGRDGGQQRLVGVLHPGVALAVAVGARHGLGHGAAVEVLDQQRSDLGVAVLAVGLDRSGSAGSDDDQHGAHQCGLKRESTHASSSRLRSPPDGS
jgi:hypothetical protein